MAACVLCNPERLVLFGRAGALSDRCLFLGGNLIHEKMLFIGFTRLERGRPKLQKQTPSKPEIETPLREGDTKCKKTEAVSQRLNLNQTAHCCINADCSVVQIWTCTITVSFHPFLRSFLGSRNGIQPNSLK